MASQPVRIRDGTAADLGDIILLLQDARLRVQGIGATSLWVADGGRRQGVLGVVGLEQHGDAGLLRSLTVRRDRRREGVGRSLVEHVVGQGRARGLTALYVITTRAEEYLIATGFERIDRREAPPALAASPLNGAFPADAPLLVRPLSR